MKNRNVFGRGDRARMLTLLGVRRPTQILAMALTTAFLIIALLPLYWILVSATKNQTALYTSFGLWFHGPFSFFSNLKALFSYRTGVFARWLLNTFLYTAIGGGGATVIASLAGYAFSRFEFKGKQLLFGFILASLFVPFTALTIPTYILYSKIGLVNTMVGMIVPSLILPVGAYLMRIFIDGTVPRDLIDAARVDGARELLIFGRIAVPLMLPGAVTVLLFSVVATWNNYFLPYIIFSKESLYPLTVGLSLWANQAAGGGSAAQLYPLVVTGAVVGLTPIMIVFILLQRYWRVGLLAGAVTS